jgi:hypothetical protein
MKHYNKARDMTEAERFDLGCFFAHLEFGPYLHPAQMAEVMRAVREAHIQVFEGHFTDGHLVTLIWSKNYPYLPNHIERLKMDKNKIFTLLPHYERRKYTRVE